MHYFCYHACSHVNTRKHPYLSHAQIGCLCFTRTSDRGSILSREEGRKIKCICLVTGAVAGSLAPFSPIVSKAACVALYFVNTFFFFGAAHFL